MQKVSNINIRVDAKLKKQANDLFEYFGMSLSQAITLFLKQSVNTSSIPFEIKKVDFTNDFKEAIEEAEEIEKNPKKHKSFDNVESFMEDLHNEIQNTKNKKIR